MDSFGKTQGVRFPEPYTLSCTLTFQDVSLARVDLL